MYRKQEFEAWKKMRKTLIVAQTLTSVILVLYILFATYLNLLYGTPFHPIILRYRSIYECKPYIEGLG